ncbi:MAG: inositol monophosphatase family protein [Chloroflexota bacterium]
MTLSATPTLTEVEALARHAGEILRSGYGQSLRVYHKGAIDLVTEYDRLSEEYLVGEVRRRYPAHSIIAEEGGRTAGQPDRVWHIDPLDGTVNFAHGIPIFSVTIAYEEQGALRLGVVYDPMRDELFSAEAGQGARLNGEPVHPSEADDLDQALLVTGFPYDIRTSPQNNLDNYARLARVSQGVRRLGSAALDLAYLACGRFDGYWELKLNSYDCAGGGLVALEAGAVVTNSQGDPRFWAPPCSIIAAASARLHRQLLEMTSG